MITQPQLGEHYSLKSQDILPFFDGIFAVAFTLMSYSIPDQLSGSSAGIKDLLFAIIAFVLSGITVLLYWYKLRRLVLIARVLRFHQVVLGFFNLLVIVTLPKAVTLAVRYGLGSGDLFHWTQAQIANTIFLGTLFCFDLLVLLFIRSLRHHGLCNAAQAKVVKAIEKSQQIGFAALVILASLEMLADWFNSQYVLIIPLVLLAEEIFVSRQFRQT